MEIIFCWPMKPCQQPSDWVYLTVRIVGGHVGAHDLRRVLAMSRPVLNLFWARMRAADSGLMAFPCAALLLFQTGNGFDVVLVLGHVNLLKEKLCLRKSPSAPQRLVEANCMTK
jgi:hypothetical protein